MDQEVLYSTLFIQFRNFKEKLDITKKYDRKAKMEIIEDKYVYVELKEAAN